MLLYSVWVFVVLGEYGVLMMYFGVGIVELLGVMLEVVIVGEWLG